ncbi:MAG: ArnT family glycosyltransferase [Parvularculaceae bacterium]
MTAGTRNAARLAHIAAIAAFAALVGLAGLWSLPPLDRDEVRFAQATAQMLETGDYIAIRFQDAERNKKPSGIYWLQAASVSAFSSVEAREIWAYRLPSLAGAVLAAVFTYLAGVRLFGRREGLLGAALLASAPAVAAEATIAKTDAMLLAAICLMQLAFIEIYARAEAGAARRGWAWQIIFWLALAAGILLKGPIAPMIAGLTGAGLFLRKPRLAWLARLRPLAGLFILVILVAPWAAAIGAATEGRFFVEAFGGDMLSKVGAAQESHAGPPGYYLVLSWVLLWPLAALIPSGLLNAWRARNDWRMHFLLVWLIPAWIVFELSATKLPHYVLPLYPVLALFAARAVFAGGETPAWARKAGGLIYVAVGLTFSAVIAALPVLYNAAPIAPYCFVGAGAFAVATLAVAVVFWRGRDAGGGYAAAVLSAALAWTVLNAVLPNLHELRISPRLSEALDAADLHPLRDGAGPVALAGYYEPSAVFLIGTNTVLTDGAGAARHLAESPESAAIVERRMQAQFEAALSDVGMSARALAVVGGLNYSNGDTVSLTVYAVAPPQS